MYLADSRIIRVLHILTKSGDTTAEVMLTVGVGQWVYVPFLK